METLKLDNQVAVPLIRLEPPTEAIRETAGHVLRLKAASRMSPHLSQKTQRSGAATCSSATA
jgi:hypothetical protein